MPVQARPKALSVTELNKSIQGLLENSFLDVWVEGEVSDPRLFPSGHTYFTLKDADSQISAVLFRGNSSGLKFKLEHGLVVLARGRVSAYIKRGQYQLIVSELEPRAMGALQLAFEQLKAKLQAEGLFDASRKRPLPSMPRRIGIVTSREGAALRDMLTILKRRCENLEILIYPVRVQGGEAKHEIVQAISDLNRQFPELEVLLVGRGGGSLEDLWAFNEESVARAIAGSRIPVISCVGHETDFTIADFVADLRAPTPSAAAELVVKNKAEVESHLGQLVIRLTRGLRHKLSNRELHLHHLVQSRLVPVLKRRLERLEDRLRRLVDSAAFRYPMRRVEEAARRLDELAASLLAAMKRRVDDARTELDACLGKLHVLSPLAVLGRGYSIAFKLPSRTLVKDASKLSKGDRLELRLHKGKVEAQVTESKPGPEAEAELPKPTKPRRLPGAPQLDLFGG